MVYFLLSDVVTNNTEPSRIRVVLNNPPQSTLGFSSHIVCLIKNNNFEGRTFNTAVRIPNHHDGSIGFNLVSDLANTSVIRGIELEDPLPHEVLPVEFSCKCQKNTSLAGARRPVKK